MDAILEAVVLQLPLDRILGNCLDILLRLSWLSEMPRAGVFLTEQGAAGEPVLRLVTERGLGEPTVSRCAEVAFGHCLCGRAALEKSTVHASSISDNHDASFDGMQPHGSYNVPIIFCGEVLGVMVFYLPHGTERNDDDIQFLERVAATLSLMISLNRQTEQLSEKIRGFDGLKMALDEHAIVSATDVKGTITYANDKFCEISGYSRDELIGANHRLIKSDEHPPAFYRDIWQTIAKGDIWRGELKNRRKGGGYYWVAATIVPFLDDTGKPSQYVAIRTDITSRKSKEEALAQSIAAVKADNEAKSQFLATMSHEIRTPMTGIIGFAEMLLADELPRQSKEKVCRILDSSRALLTILNDILDMSKLDATKLELESLDFHLPSLIDDALSLFREKRHGSRNQKIDLTAELSDDFPTGLRGDPTRVNQVLVNLIGNAIKFTDEGSVSVIGSMIRLDTPRPSVRIAVRDTGIGINQETIDALFTAFTQADVTIARRFKGTGLGLSICKKLVELMGGEIGVISEPGKGSEFWFTLPYDPAIGEVSAPSRSSALPVSFVGSKPLHILVVDDNVNNRRIIGAIVTAFGHTHETAENGAEAIKAHREGEFDLILMDIRMPVMPGTEATAAIRQMEDARRAVPIIALTADAMENQKAVYFEAGMDAVVTKPIDRAQLARVINEVMGADIHVPPDPQPEASTDFDATGDAPPPDDEVNADVAAFLQQLEAEP